jgi:hypothetical protein
MRIDEKYIKHYTPVRPDKEGFTPGKEKQVVVNQETKTIEWQRTGSLLKPGEAEFIAKRLGVKGKIPVERYQKIKTEIVAGKSRAQMVRKFAGQKGYREGTIAKISAALSDFNGWTNRKLCRKKLEQGK